MDNDGNIIKRAKRVLDMHFGVRNTDGDTVCARCGSLDVAWPCEAATLAQDVQIAVLAR